MTAVARPAFTVRGWHVAAAVVGFFAVIIAVDAAFLVLAYRSHPGQVAARPYEAGLLYNAELERHRAQAALGWRASAEAAPQGVVVRLRDRDGAPLTGLEVTASLQRPATERGRQDLVLREAAPGRYESAGATLNGVWDVEVTAVDAAGQAFVAERRLRWR